MGLVPRRSADDMRSQLPANVAISQSTTRLQANVILKISQSSGKSPSCPAGKGDSTFRSLGGIAMTWTAACPTCSLREAARYKRGRGVSIPGLNSVNLSLYGR